MTWCRYCSVHLPRREETNANTLDRLRADVVVSVTAASPRPTGSIPGANSLAYQCG